MKPQLRQLGCLHTRRDSFYTSTASVSSRCISFPGTSTQRFTPDILHRNTISPATMYLRQREGNKSALRCFYQLNLVDRRFRHTNQARETNYARDLHARTMVLPRLAFSWHLIKTYLLNTYIRTWWHA